MLETYSKPAALHRGVGTAPEKLLHADIQTKEQICEGEPRTPETPPAKINGNSRQALPQALGFPGRRGAACGRGHAGGRGREAGTELVRGRDGARMRDRAEARGRSQLARAERRAGRRAGSPCAEGRRARAALRPLACGPRRRGPTSL